MYVSKRVLYVAPKKQCCSLGQRNLLSTNAYK